MSGVRVLGPAASGAVYLYHASLSTGEHFFVGRIRRTATVTYLTCHLCDSVTMVPRREVNADHRALQAFIDAGAVVPSAHASERDPDPLQAAREDGVAGIPAVIPQDTAGRIALRNTLKAAHIDKRPAGTRFQKRVGSTVEVWEDTLGNGVATKREEWTMTARKTVKVPRAQWHKSASKSRNAKK